MAYQLSHRTGKKVSKGNYYSLGATCTAEGVNFALYSQHASQVFLLLFDTTESDPTDIIRLENKTKNIWHCQVHGIKQDQRALEQELSNRIASMSHRESL